MCIKDKQIMLFYTRLIETWGHLAGKLFHLSRIYDHLKQPYLLHLKLLNRIANCFIALIDYTIEDYTSTDCKCIGINHHGMY